MSRLPVSRRTLSIVAVLVPLALLLVYVAVRSGPLAPVAVTVAKVESRALHPALFGVGTVEARQLQRLGPTAPGRLIRLAVDVGDRVKAGQVLGEMDPVDSDERLRSQMAVVQRTAATVVDARARQAFAQQQAHRYEQLYAENATSEELRAQRRQEGLQAQAALSVAQAEQARAESDLQALRAQRQNLRLVAPMDGVVTAREVEPGTTVVAGQTVLELVNPSSLWVQARFDQIGAGGLVAGLPAQVALRSRRGVTIEGQVLRIEGRADAVTEEFLAKIGFRAGPSPLPALGERAEVTVQLTALPEGPVLPNAAVQRQGAQVGVWMAEGDALRFVPVTLGRGDLDGWVQVLDGLKAGDTVVLHSEKTLQPDVRVRVVNSLPGVKP